jgi:hypothetical protein
MIQKMGAGQEGWKGYVREEGLLSGRGLDCGHYIPEEKSGEVLEEILQFMIWYAEVRVLSVGSGGNN